MAALKGGKSALPKPPELLQPNDVNEGLLLARGYKAARFLDFC